MTRQSWRNLSQLERGGDVYIETAVMKILCSLLVCLAFRLAGVSLAQGQELALVRLPDAPSPQAAAVQTAPPAPAATTPATGGQATSSSASESQLKAEEKQRLLGIMPAFNTVESGEAVPLRPSQKFSLWYHAAIDPFTFGISGVDAGIEQAENTYPEYGQGAAGFGKRFGSSYADNVDGNFWGNAVLPVLLHQDPRYFRLGHGSAKHRLGYAALSTVRCKSDSGKWEPNVSNVGGNLIGGAISNLYYPASDRGVALIFERGLTVTGEGAFGAFAFEFYPDLIRYYKRRHQAALSAKLSPAQTAQH